MPTGVWHGFMTHSPTVPEGGELSITAGGMTEGNGTCGKHQKGGNVPEGGEPHPILLLFAPYGDDWRE